MKSYLECPKRSIEDFFSWLVCVKCHGVLEGQRKIHKFGRSIPHTKSDIGENALLEYLLLLLSYT